MAKMIWIECPACHHREPMNRTLVTCPVCGAEWLDISSDYESLRDQWPQRRLSDP